MKSLIILTIISLLSQRSIFAQKQKGIINDPDGYANLRSGKSADSKVIKEIFEGHKFEYIPDSKNDWWQVTTYDGSTGFIHKSRIQPYFVFYENSCPCKNHSYTEENVDFSAKVGDHIISICGYLLQRNSAAKIKITEFTIYDCTSDTVLAFYGALQECYVEYINDRLNITELINAPVGSKWKWESTPIYKTFISKTDGVIKLGDKEKAFSAENISIDDINKLNEEANNIRKSGQKPTFEMCEHYMGRLFVGAMKGNQKSKEILLNFGDYYNIIYGHLSEMQSEYIDHLEYYGLK